MEINKILRNCSRPEPGFEVQPPGKYAYASHTNMLFYLRLLYMRQFFPLTTTTHQHHQPLGVPLQIRAPNQGGWGELSLGPRGSVPAQLSW